MPAELRDSHVSQDKGSSERRKVTEFEAVPGEAEADLAQHAFLADDRPGAVNLTAALAEANGAQRARVVGHLQARHGNQFVQRMLATREPAVVQRENGEEEEEDEGGEALPTMPSLRLQEPSLLGSGQPTASAWPDLQLRLDPELMARTQEIQRQLGADSLRASLGSLQLGTPQPFLPTTTPATAAEPLVPRGAGPARPREASPNDLLSAAMGLPAVERMLAQLRLRVTERLESDWRHMGTGERAAVISGLAVVAGGALAGVMSDPEARRFALDQLNGRVLPVPGVDWLQLEVNTERGNLMLGVHVDVGALLPASLGFGPSSPSAIGGPPQPAPSPGGQ